MCFHVTWPLRTRGRITHHLNPVEVALNFKRLCRISILQNPCTSGYFWSAIHSILNSCIQSCFSYWQGITKSFDFLVFSFARNKLENITTYYSVARHDIYSHIRLNIMNPLLLQCHCNGPSIVQFYNSPKCRYHEDYITNEPTQGLQHKDFYPCIC